jgi:Helix-turn-helix.
MIKNKSDFQEEIISKIKYLRTENDISQLELSKILSISNGQIGNIESPRYKHKYTLKQIKLFCEYINFPIEKLFLSKEECIAEDKLKLLINKIIEYYE